MLTTPWSFAILAWQVQCIGGRATQEFSHEELVEAFGLHSATLLVESYAVLASRQKQAEPAEGEAEQAQVDMGEAEHPDSVRVTLTDRQITSGPTTDYKADRHTSKQARTTVFGSLHHKRRVLRRRTVAMPPSAADGLEDL